MAERRRNTGGNIKGSKHADLIQKASVVASYEAGMSYEAIETKYGIPRNTFRKWISSYRDTQNLERKDGSGRKRKTTASEDQHIILSVKRNRETTSQEVADSFGDRNVSSRLICRRIRELSDMKSHWKIKKPFINARNRRRRVRWCMDRLHYTLDQW